MVWGSGAMGAGGAGSRHADIGINGDGGVSGGDGDEAGSQCWG